MVYKATDYAGMTYDLDSITAEIDNKLKFSGRVEWSIRNTFSHYPKRIVESAVTKITELYKEAGWNVDRVSGNCIGDDDDELEYWDYLLISK